MSRDTDAHAGPWPVGALLDSQPCLERVFLEPPGRDLLLMRFSSDPQHLAICAGATIIHAYEDGWKVLRHNK